MRICSAWLREKFPLWCRNSNTGEVFGGTQAALENYPASENGMEHADGEFTFKVFDYSYTA